MALLITQLNDITFYLKGLYYILIHIPLENIVILVSISTVHS